LSTGATYHVCPKQKLFASFEKLDECLVSLGDGHICQIEGICTVSIKLFDGMIRELKDVRYVPQLKKNLISVGALEAQGLRETIGEGVLEMSSDSLVVLKGIRRNNLYYVKGSAATENMIASEQLEGDSIRLWQLRLEHVDLNYWKVY